MPFHRGQKVVCVDASGTLLVVKDQIYVVDRGDHYDSLGGPYIWLEGVADRFKVPPFSGAGMLAARFRPLVENKQKSTERGMKTLRAILKSPTKVLEDAE